MQVMNSAASDVDLASCGETQRVSGETHFCTSLAMTCPYTIWRVHSGLAEGAPITPPEMVPRMRSTPLLSVVSTFSDSTTHTVVIAYRRSHSRDCAHVIIAMLVSVA